MFRTSSHSLEALESRVCLAATAVVTDGDLVIEGDADGAIEIVVIAEGSYQVSDNGILIADETTLNGITDDIRVHLEQNVEGTADTAFIGGATTLGLGEQVENRTGCGRGQGYEHRRGFGAFGRGVCR